MPLERFLLKALRQRPLDKAKRETGWQAKRIDRHCNRAQRPYKPPLTGASSKVNIAWRRRAGAIGGGTDASLR